MQGSHRGTGTTVNRDGSGGSGSSWGQGAEERDLGGVVEQLGMSL